MYKLLLCLRYLRTRYIALASIISVMLGVATMIVVNSVMAGFVAEMEDRMHGVLSDVIFEYRSLEGMRDAEWHMEQIRQVAGDQIAGMTPTVVVPAMLNFQYGDEWITRPVQLIGIDERTHSSASDFGKYLQHPENRKQMSFDLREGGYDTKDHQGGDEARPRKEMEGAGWQYRRWTARNEAFRRRFSPMSEPTENSREGMPSALPELDETTVHPLEMRWPLRQAGHQAELQPVKAGEGRPKQLFRLPRRIEPELDRVEVVDHRASAPLPDELVPLHSTSVADRLTAVPATAPQAGPYSLPPMTRPVSATPSANRPLSDPFLNRAETNRIFNPENEQHTGVVLGIALAAFRTPDGNEERFLTLPGGDVKLTFPTAGTPPKGISDNFTIVDFYECKMSEYDSTFVFVPIRKLQELRGMIDPTTGVGYVNSIQIKVKPGVDGAAVRDKLRKAFVSASELYSVSTWRDKQGPLLAAVAMETAILNVLLFLIIAVAGFGILAIFLMIVVEKTRDIGVLKSLGASSQGVMGIFVAYGASLGVVGAGVGTVLGLLFVDRINEIAAVLGWLTGRPVFDPTIYYFYKIPTIVDPGTVISIVAGAMAIAVLASILPALRAALLHPVEALRYE